MMNFQPNASQTEKIPKSVLSIILQIVKLNENNWAIWEPMFMDCICPIKNAKCTLTGEILVGHDDYDKELDKHDEEEQLGSSLYKKLRAALTINDEVKLSAIHDHIHEIKLLNHNVINLGKELDKIWNDAARLGNHMDEKLKKSTLYCCIKDDWLYTQTVDSLKATQPGCNYEYAYHALAKKCQEAELSATHHMVHDEDKLIAPTLKQGSIDTAGHEWLQVQAIGNATLQVGDIKIPLTDVLHIPNLSKNLLSIPVLTENGACVIFEESGATILQHDGSMVKSKTNQHKKRWEIYGNSLAAQLNNPLEGLDNNIMPAEPTSSTTSKLWHK
ncbi:uncharacterized protein UHO2_05406 [Ustilago hordei]|uniref:uncharacterized protein n=1 Tax=Ustilago hordei TaxID=120017 RepID=UPI001A42522A|nr:uncharacterized protein UHO2_05406 [Ustilago hordei]SYW86782.1 uncharacterized protein UHO2_05406 [Ustilago hordei]